MHRGAVKRLPRLSLQHFKDAPMGEWPVFIGTLFAGYYKSHSSEVALLVQRPFTDPGIALCFEKRNFACLETKRPLQGWEVTTGNIDDLKVFLADHREKYPLPEKKDAGEDE